ncbi:MAG: hypothetical protein ACK55I_37295, partial [bacterium]
RRPLSADRSALAHERVDDGPFGRCERPRLSRFQIAEADRAELRAHQPFDLEAERIADAPDFVGLAFGDGDFERPPPCTKRMRLHIARHHQSVFEFDALAGLPDGRHGVAAHRGHVGAFDLAAGVRERMRRRAICR